MDHWPAPYQNNSGHWCFTYDQKRFGRNFLQTSVKFTVSTQYYCNECNNTEFWKLYIG